jgi:hypothetical protein
VSSPSENVQDELGSIDDLDVRHFGYRSRLRRREGLIEDDHVRPSMERLDQNILQFPAPQHVTLMTVLRPLRHSVDDRDTCRRGQLCEFQQTIFLFDSAS